GFSGARLWRIEGTAGPLCLRAWPKVTMPERLAFIHRAMRTAYDSGLAFVPVVFATHDGFTVLRAADRLWDLTAWLPGRTGVDERPSLERLTSACVALAQLHSAWAPCFSYRPGPSPAVRRRLDRVREWFALLTSGWQPAFDVPGADPVRPWAEQ